MLTFECTQVNSSDFRVSLWFLYESCQCMCSPRLELPGMNWVSLGLLEERLQTRADWSDLACNCVLFGLYDGVLFPPFNLLPTFQNSEISHKNWGFWLLLKKKRIWQHWASIPSWQQLSWSWTVTSLDPALSAALSIWVCDPDCRGFRSYFLNLTLFLFITFLLILLLKHAIWLWPISLEYKFCLQ